MANLQITPLVVEPNPSGVEIPDPETIENPSLRYAMTQLTVASNLRMQSQSLLDDVQYTQDLQAEASEYLDVFRKNQSDASNGTGNLGNRVTITQEQVDWCRKNGIELPGRVNNGDYNLNDAEWDLISKGTQAHIDKLGANTQQQMVLAQDALGQYNAYTQGANSSVNSSSDTYKYVAKGQ